eukprot:jgi/Psemu1/12965/gm1.12965_g
MASSSPSVVVVHSSTPGHDCDVLEAILPRRYRRSEDIRDRVVSFLSSEKAFERILLVPTPGGGLPEAETDTETETETKTKTETTNRRSTQGAEGSSVSVSDDNEFETVLLTTTTTKNNTSTNGNGNGKPRVSAKLATSFASLILDSHDEISIDGGTSRGPNGIDGGTNEDRIELALEIELALGFVPFARKICPPRWMPNHSVYCPGLDDPTGAESDSGLYDDSDYDYHGSIGTGFGFGIEHPFEIFNFHETNFIHAQHGASDGDNNNNNNNNEWEKQ